MKKTIEITIEQARKLRNMPEWKEVIEANFTKEELDGKVFDYESIASKRKDCVYTLRFPRMKIAGREINRMKWITVAYEANGDWEPNWHNENENKWYLHNTTNGIVFKTHQTYNGGEVFFKSEELIMKAYEANKGIVKGMFE